MTRKRHLAAVTAVTALFAVLAAVPATRGSVITPPVSDATRLTVTLPNGTVTTMPAALDPSFALTQRRGRGASMQIVGDSRAALGNAYAPADATSPGITVGQQNPLGWAAIYSGQALTFDPSSGPYVPAAAKGAIIDWKVVGGGSGYTAPTLSVPVASGHAATLNVAGGKIVSVTVTAYGAAPTAGVTKSQNLVISDATGSGAVITPVLNGSATYAVSGTTLDECLARLGDIVTQKYAPRPDFLVVKCGTNDMPAVVAGTVTMSSRLALAMSIVQTATAAGMHVVYVAENPKSNAAFGGNTTAGNNGALANEGFDQGLRAMAALDPVLNPNRVPFELVDMGRSLVNGATSAGASRDGTTLIDGLHSATWGAQLEGYGIEQALRPFYNPLNQPSYSSLGYDANYNPLGNLIPNFAGTGGTPTGLATGQAPNGWSVGTNDGSGTGSIASAVTYPTVTAPDTGGTGGNGLVMPAWTLTFALNNDGSASGNVYGQYTIPIANLTAGNRIRASCEIALSGVQNITGIDMQIQDGTVLSHYQPTGSSYYMAPAFDPLVGTLPPAGALTPSRMSVDYPVTAATISANSLKIKFQVGFDASASPFSQYIGAAIGTGVHGTKVTVRDCRVVKVGTALIH